LLSLLFSTLLWTDLGNSYIWIAIVSLVLYGSIGFYDDWLKLQKIQNGLSARGKLLLQFVSAFIIVWLLYVAQGSDSTALTTVSAPFFKHINPDFGLFYFPFAMLVIVAVSNAVNLTDGLDGLAIGPVIIAFAAYMLICYVTGNVKFTSYLSIQYIQQVDEMTIFCGAVVGASLGFLWYNCHPAALFMGNVGSTALGGLLGTVAIMSKQEFALILIGGIFVAEAVSVILQVYWYKTTGRRLFLMAPLHHHFEKLGWPESQVIVRFWIVALALALLSLSFLKIR
ncbi:MAG: phospho-N-acetylmuramoyl-pentapeptide-transferase, partial [Nitrospinota bacterium]